MRVQRRSVSRLQPGMALAAPVLRNDGVLLLRQGTVLNEAHIESLRGLVSAVYVLREGFEDVARIARLPDENLRFSLVKKIEAVYCALYETYHARASRKGMAPPRDPSTLSPSVRGASGTDDLLREVVRAIVEDVRERRYALLSFEAETPKHNMLYLFEHVFSSAVLAARLLESAWREGEFRYVDTVQGWKTRASVPIDEKRLEDVLAGVLLMELGMLSIPREVLAKPRFSEEERAEWLLPHPLVGREILRGLLSATPMMVNLVLNHHERRDGTGYPRGIRDFHALVDVAVVASSFDAIVSSRPQHQDLGGAGDDKAFPPGEAMDQLYALSARGQVNAGILEELARYVVPYPFGTTLILSNGDVGLVADCTDRVDPLRRSRPLIRCNMNIDRNERGPLREVDLAKRIDLGIRGAIYA